MLVKTLSSSHQNITYSHCDVLLNEKKTWFLDVIIEHQLSMLNTQKTVMVDNIINNKNRNRSSGKPHTSQNIIHHSENMWYFHEMMIMSWLTCLVLILFKSQFLIHKVFTHHNIAEILLWLAIINTNQSIKQIR
jgi:hypothetical protein